MEAIGGNFDLEETLESITSADEKEKKIKAYRIAVAKERNNVYKPIEYETNYGYRSYVMNQSDVGNGTSITLSPSTRSSSEIYKIDVVISDTNNTATNVYTDTMTITINGKSASVVIPTTSTATRTVEFEINGSGSSASSIKINFNSSTKVTVREIKIYYK